MYAQKKYACLDSAPSGLSKQAYFLKELSAQAQFVLRKISWSTARIIDRSDIKCGPIVH